ncbi:MAG: cation:proton antiporter [Hahellaceae bacterium]|nr:cation:proton antiporter [Hahellaceae bacterium]MCP5209598.1 cation:proton antiporter [Hahellaceae bacterium]
MSSIGVSVLGLMGLLALAVLMLPAAKRLSFPFTVLLAAVGTLLGIIQPVIVDLPLMGPIKDFLHALESFDVTAEAIFFIFLPTLIFEAGLGIDVRRLMDDLGPILMLAILGLLLSTFIIGATVHWVTAVPILVCFLIGAICSATDPVAVVALFKEMGAPKRLSILVDGESLFNDATAIVLFTILISVITGHESASVSSAVVEFIKVFFGGVIWGYLAGHLLCWLMRHFLHLILVNITLSICCAYLTFITAEHYFHISGVMAVVTAALVTSSIGRTIISPRDWFELEQIWEQVGFWANSIIFILVGMTVPRLLHDIDFTATLGLIALTVSALFARALITYGMLPALTFLGVGKPVNLAYKTVMFWGGLRGAVSLALALAVIENPAIPEQSQKYIAILVTGFVLFTLFVNATTVRFVMRFFELGKLKNIEVIMRDKAVSNSLAKISDKLKHFGEAHPRHPHVIEELVQSYATQSEDLKQRAEANNISHNQWVSLGLSILAAQEKRYYFMQFSEGLMHSHIFRLLSAQVDELIDTLKQEGMAGYSSQIDRNLDFDWRYKIAAFALRRLHIQTYLSRRLAERLYLLTASRSALHYLKQKQFDKIQSYLPPDTLSILQAYTQLRAQKTEQALAALAGQYPEYSSELLKRQMLQSALWQEEREYQSLEKDGLITADAFKGLNRDVQRKISRLGTLPPLDLQLHPERLIRKVPLFSHCNAEQIAAISKLLRPEMYFPGNKIINRGSIGNKMYFIASGAVKVALSGQPVTLASGDFFGEIAVLKKTARTADVISLGYCTLLVLGHNEFHRFLSVNKDLKQIIEKAGEERLQELITPPPAGLPT